jgi:hypothetical protein
MVRAMASHSTSFFDRTIVRWPSSTAPRVWLEPLASIAGTSKANSEPRPRSLATEIVPPSASTMRREMARPRPAPPCARVELPSACSNSSKMRCMSSLRNPGPVSETAKRTRSTSPAPGFTLTVISTPPSSVNLMALPIRLSSTWRTRPGSAVIVCGTLGAT